MNDAIRPSARDESAVAGPIAPAHAKTARDLHDFVFESNRIEGIKRRPRKDEIDAHVTLLSLPAITVRELLIFIHRVAPGHRLHDREGLDVGGDLHAPPPGGSDMLPRLNAILDQAENGDPCLIYRAFDVLRPFTGGNGPAGRALWLWMMLRGDQDPHALQRGFLCTWHHQSLASGRTKP